MASQDIGSTTSGYMTPDQIAQMQQYSSDLTKGGMRDKEITSPWQGVRMMADALSGNIMRNRAGQQQQQNTRLLGDAQSGVEGSTFPPLGQSQLQPQQPITPTPPVRPPPSMSGSPVPGLQGSVPSGMPGGMPSAPVDPMQALMMQPPGQGMA